jgi:hypothetical protein
LGLPVGIPRHLASIASIGYGGEGSLWLFCFFGYSWSFMVMYQVNEFLESY